jgi:hypothetical protein
MDPATDWVVDDGQLCLDFDGSNDYVAIGRPNQIDPITDDFTLSVWCKPTGSFQSFRNVIGKASNAAGQFGISVDSGGTWYAQFGNASATAGGNMSLNVWYFLSYTLKATQAVLYQNGVRVNSSTTSTAVIAADMQIGADVTNGRYFAGQIDDYQFRNRALNASEMLQLYRLGRGGIYQPAYRPAYYTETDAGGGGITSRPYAWQSARIIGAGR